LIAIGIAAIVIFFLSDAIKSMRGFGFSIGVALVILGCCTMLRAGDVVRDLTLYMGLLALILGITLLQNAVQLHYLKSVLWIVELVLSIVTLLGAIFVLADFRPIIDSVDGFVYWVLLIAGAASLIGILLMAIGLRGAKKRADKEAVLASASAQAAANIAESAASAVPEPVADTPAEPAASAAADSADEILSATVEQPTLTFDSTTEPKPHTQPSVEPDNIPEYDQSTSIDPSVAELLDDSSINLDPPDISK
ncbi:MAG: hypothetical protein IJG63_02535, partial [Oscillospiraceae bacterium]|nr:hypothetical protein [Oscillospiraceae bacterium]